MSWLPDLWRQADHLAKPPVVLGHG